MRLYTVAGSRARLHLSWPVGPGFLDPPRGDLESTKGGNSSELAWEKVSQCLGHSLLLRNYPVLDFDTYKSVDNR
jgi:hypothetical protein